MSPRNVASWSHAMTDFALLAAAGYGAWRLFDMAVTDSWCAGGARSDSAAIVVLGMLFVGRDMGPAWGRRPWPRTALLVCTVAAAIPVAVMAGRLIAGCAGVEGEPSAWGGLLHFSAALGIGLATLAAYLALAKVLPAAEPVRARPARQLVGLRETVAAIGALAGSVLTILMFPDLIAAAGAALFAGYCPDADGMNLFYLVALIPLLDGAEDRGRAAWRAVFLTGLAALSLMAAGDVLSGLLIACPPAGEELAGAQWSLKLGLQAAGFAAALTLTVRFRNRSRAGQDERKTDAPAEGEPRP